MKNETFNLGFTFSFPCEQKNLTNAILVRWTKGFAVSGVEGQNVAELLQTAINKIVNLFFLCIYLKKLIIIFILSFNVLIFRE